MVDAPKADLYAADGTRQGEVDLDPAVFAIEPNVGVMHQVVTAQLAAARAGTHSTLRRGEVRGGGRKPWRQKGIGRARHGSIRSPIWVGGGVAHGPKPRSYRQRVNKKVKRLALRSALSVRAAEGQVKVVEAFGWDTPRTKQAKAFLAAAGVAGKALVVLGPGDAMATKSFRNLSTVRLCMASQLNTYDVLWADTLVFTTDTLGSASGTPDYDVAEDDFELENSASDSPDADTDAVPEPVGSASGSAAAETGDDA